MQQLVSSDKVVGLKQVLKLGDSGSLCRIYIAQDADEGVKDALIKAAKKNSIECVFCPSKKELGEVCGIDVSAACAGVLKD